MSKRKQNIIGGTVGLLATIGLGILCYVVSPATVMPAVAGGIAGVIVTLILSNKFLK